MAECVDARQVDSLLSRLLSLEERIDGCEDQLNIELDHRSRPAPGGSCPACCCTPQSTICAVSKLPFLATEHAAHVEPRPAWCLLDERQWLKRVWMALQEE